MITHAETIAIYNDNAFLKFTTMDAIWERIRNAASFGAYTVHIEFDLSDDNALEAKNAVWKTLREHGFMEVYSYSSNPSNINTGNDILEVRWS